MSVWYQMKISAYGSREHLAKLVGLDPEHCHLDMVRLEAGAKNSPAINIEELAMKHYGLIFLVQTTVECCSGSSFLIRYDNVVKNMQYVPLDHFDYDHVERNIKLMEDYPEIRVKNSSFSWGSFCYDDSKTNAILNNYAKYQDLAIEVSQEDIELDNAELVTDD